ncbi:MAG TPA: hypothetical protein VKS81_03975 [Bacteroidota bacterium]|nr:hypothetical protein [Bacteroidota bacterium]
MKRSLSFVFAIAMLVVAMALNSCDNTPPSAPQTTGTHSNLQNAKGKSNLGDGLASALLPDTITGFISAANGGVIYLPSAVTGMYNGKPTKASASIYFPPGAVYQDVYVTMRLSQPTNTDFYATFSPSPLSFATPAYLTITATNADANDFGSNFYCVDNGQSEPYNSMNINVEANTVTVSGGAVPHFSIYAFGR